MLASKPRSPCAQSTLGALTSAASSPPAPHTRAANTPGFSDAGNTNFTECAEGWIASNAAPC
ncbi:MAG: hypothetical protein FJ388_11690 [Verrucomicrobia bacterium]|nr:hypothetical protein [Verrucomicrobiota bacterium]